ncbi:MAG TPA: glucoamylase family protein, partial [Polyangiaceae bacterium]
MTERADRRFLVKVLRQAFEYFAHESDEDSGLVLDKTKGEFASIAAVGFGLSVYPIGVERGYWSRKKAIARTLAALRFFRESAQGKERDATGYKGFYYHFLDMTSGRRAARSELSTIDTAILIAGALMAATYFDRANADEREIRRSAEDLFARVDWRWMLDAHKLLRHGWKPESGFIPHVWSGYNEAHVLYLLGLASPTSTLPKASYRAWTDTFEWRTVFGQSYFHAAPLFIHQLSQTWFDLRSIRDAATRRRKLSYFENSRRATYAQQAYAIRNPGRFEHYGERSWGLTASDGPGPSVRTIGGRRIRFFDYVARGIPEGPDDGTLAP